MARGRAARASGRKNPRPKNPPALIHESYSADYTAINQWAKRADGQWFARSQYKDPRYGYKWGRWRETTERSLPLRMSPTRIYARLPRIEVEPASGYDVVVDGRVIGRFETFAGASNAARDAHRPGAPARVVPRENGRGCRSCRSRRPSRARAIVRNTADNRETPRVAELRRLLEETRHVTYGLAVGRDERKRAQSATWYQAVDTLEFAEARPGEPAAARLVERDIAQLEALPRKARPNRSPARLSRRKGRR